MSNHHDVRHPLVSQVLASRAEAGYLSQTQRQQQKKTQSQHNKVKKDIINMRPLDP